MTLESTGAITFFYYRDLAAAADFYENAFGFELVNDQGWTRIYRIQGTAHLGVVAGERAFCQPRDENAVLLTLVVRDVDAWHAKLVDRGVRILREPETHDDIQVRCFFAEDPGGYAVEIQTFLDPLIAKRFGL